MERLQGLLADLSQSPEALFLAAAVVLGLLFRRALRRPSPASRKQRKRRPKSRRARQARQARQGPQRPDVVIDGSNVLYWRDDRPDIGPLRILVNSLSAGGHVPLVWFDANAGYLVSGRYLDNRRLAVLLDLPADRVRVAPRGTPADPLLLADAVRLAVPVVSDDRFRDWPEAAQLRLVPRDDARLSAIFAAGVTRPAPASSSSMVSSGLQVRRGAV